MIGLFLGLALAKLLFWIFGLAGLRLGYAVGHPAWIDEFDKVRSAVAGASRATVSMPFITTTTKAAATGRPHLIQRT